MRVLVESTPDPASRTIAKELRALAGFQPTERSVADHPVETSRELPDTVLVTIDRLHLELDDLESVLASAELRASAIVFLSKHKSETAQPALTVHPLGNFGEARFGGRPGAFTPAPAGLMTQTLRALDRERRIVDFPAEVTFEVTHHGPLLATPAFFVELGSDEAAWGDARGARVVASAVRRALSQPVAEHPIAIGIGGGHYAPRFTETALSRAVHYAHFWPRHHLGPQVESGPLFDRLVAASPGVQVVHLHDGTLPAEHLRPLEQAFARHGLPETEPTAWRVRPRS